MPPFRFRLETLLRLRLVDRDQRRADVAKAQRAEAMLREQAAEIEREQAEIRGLSRRLMSPGAGDVDALLRSHRYEMVLRSQAQQLAVQITQVVAEVNRRRQALVEADRQVRVLEKLRERQLAAHAAREAKQEMKELDELASIGFVRQEAGE